MEGRGNSIPTLAARPSKADRPPSPASQFVIVYTQCVSSFDGRVRCEFASVRFPGTPNHVERL